jgi:MFS family permease
MRSRATRGRGPWDRAARQRAASRPAPPGQVAQEQTLGQVTQGQASDQSALDERTRAGIQRPDESTSGSRLSRLGLGLSRELWLVEIGIFLNMLGYGAVLPFEIIYLHGGRGFSLSVSGLVVGTITGLAILNAPVAGPLIDRFGARTVTAIAGVALAAGYSGLAFADRPATAFAAAAFAGVGNGMLNPSQSTLLATLAPAQLRHRATAVSRVAGNAGIGLGSALGGLVAAYGLRGFVALFLANGVSYLIYVGVLVAVVRESNRPEPAAGGYRAVLRDRPFVHLAITDVAMIAVGWGAFSWLVPPFASNDIGLSARLIGLLLLANAATVVVAQVPVARLAEGRRRVAMMTVAAVLFAGAFLLVTAASFSGGASYPELLTAAVAIGLGECFHTSALMPLAAELAPDALRGRYMAVMGFSWWIGLTAAPVLGAPLLGLSAPATFLGTAAVAIAAGVSMLTLGRGLPAAAKLTPRPTSRPDRPHSIG